MATTEWSVTDRFRSRLWGWAANNLSTFGGLETRKDRLAATSDAAMRQGEYYKRWAYYANDDLYKRLKAAGMTPLLMTAEWNPVPATVSFYVANVLSGDLDIQTEDGPDEALSDAVQQVWDWSNFDVLKDDLVRDLAVFGDTLVKVAERREGGETEGDGETTAVYLQDIPPETVRYIEADERGFITAIRIDTPRLQSQFSGETYRHVLVELWRKEFTNDKGEAEPGGVRYYELRGMTNVEDAKLPIPVRDIPFTDLQYDFIPIVWVHADTPWYAYTDQVDQYNRLSLKGNLLNRPVGVTHGRHTDAEGRPMPAPRINTELVEASYEESKDGLFGWIRVPGNSQFDWANSPIDMAANDRDKASIRSGVEEALPEYRMATIDANQIAVETLQLLMSQAGQRILSVRGVLERGLVRAHMMAMSIAQLAELPGFDVGQIGTYENGDLDHTFVERGVFEPSPSMLAAVFKELKMAGMPTKLAMKAAGYAQELIDEFDAAAAEESLRERTTLAAAISRQRALVDTGAADNGLTRI